MQTKIIANDQLSGSAKEKRDGRLYFIRKETNSRSAYTQLSEHGKLTMSITFNCLMNITGISVQGKGIEPTRTVEFTKCYDVDVYYDNEKKKSSLGKVSRK